MEHSSSGAVALVTRCPPLDLLYRHYNLYLKAMHSVAAAIQPWRSSIQGRIQRPADARQFALGKQGTDRPLAIVHR